MQVQPLQDRVLVQRKEVETKTPGGIIVPENNSEKPQEGTVVSVGPGTRTDKGEWMPLTIKEGDQVLFGKFSGTEVKIDDKEFLILTESDLLGTIVQ